MLELGATEVTSVTQERANAGHISDTKHTSATAARGHTSKSTLGVGHTRN